MMDQKSAAKEFLKQVDPYDPVFSRLDKQFFIPYGIVHEIKEGVFEVVGGSLYISCEDGHNTVELLGKTRHSIMKTEKVEVVTSIRPYAYLCTNRSLWLKDANVSGYAKVSVDTYKLFVPIEAFTDGNTRVLSTELNGLISIMPLYLLGETFVRAEDLTKVPTTPDAFILNHNTLFQVFGTDHNHYTHYGAEPTLEVLVKFNQFRQVRNSTLSYDRWWTRELKQLAKKYPEVKAA